MATNSESHTEEALIKWYPVVTRSGNTAGNDLFLPLPASVTGDHFSQN